MSGFSNNFAAYGGSAVIIRNASTAGFTVESVTSTTGAANGIILENAGSGGFTVTGLGGAASSGGVISKTGADGSLTTGSAISIVNTSNVSLAHMNLGYNSNYAILGFDVGNFTLTDSAITANGSNLALHEGGVRFFNLTGTALFEGNHFDLNRGENLRIENSSGELDLTIRDSALNQAVFGYYALSGGDSVHIETSGIASMTMLIDGADFTGAVGDMLKVAALGGSTQDLTIRDSTFHNGHLLTTAGAGGVVLTGGGTGSNIDVNLRMEGNSFQGAKGNALTLFYNQAVGDVRAYIADNVVGVGDGIAGSQGSSGAGAGISVTLEKTAGPGSASLAVHLADNEIYDVESGLAAIVLRSSGGGAANPAVFEATLLNNVVTETGAFAALYALVGGSDFVGDYARMGLAMNDNLFDLGDAAFGGNAVFLDQVSMDAFFYLPGYAGSPDGEYMGGSASDDIHAYLVARGNVMVNGIYESFPGGVDAGIVMGVTGDALTIPVWFA